MKSIIFLLLIFEFSFASLIDTKSFDADFKQVVTDEHGKKLEYTGHLKALSPRYALWEYETPMKKSIYINPSRITIIEPEIEQVIIRKLSLDFDFLKIINNAKEISKDNYVTSIDDTKYVIKIKNHLITSISYKDEFDNSVNILFNNQKKNEHISKEIFRPSIPKDFDIIDR